MTEVTVRATRTTTSFEEGEELRVVRTGYVDRLIANGLLDVILEHPDEESGVAEDTSRRGLGERPDPVEPASVRTPASVRADTGADAADKGVTSENAAAGPKKSTSAKAAATDTGTKTE